MENITPLKKALRNGSLMLFAIAGIFHFIQKMSWNELASSLALSALGIFPVLWFAYSQTAKLQQKIQQTSSNAPKEISKTKKPN